MKYQITICKCWWFQRFSAVLVSVKFVPPKTIIELVTSYRPQATLREQKKTDLKISKTILIDVLYSLKTCPQCGHILKKTNTSCSEETEIGKEMRTESLCTKMFCDLHSTEVY